MAIIGLTGCPGAGKSVVANIIKNMGAVIISGDEIGKEIVDNNPKILQSLIDIFGMDIVNEEGNLQRRKLGKLVFSSSSAMKKLNGVVHPVLLLELKKRIDNHRSTNPDKALIIDAALIYEWGIADWFDKIITVFADYWLRIKRLTAAGLSEKEAHDRTDSQLDQNEKIRRADYTIENNALLKDLEFKVQKLSGKLFPVK